MVTKEEWAELEAKVRGYEQWKLRKEAERRVLAVRGSRDAPGFEACVLAEMLRLKEVK